MSKITISAILTIIRILFTLGEKLVRGLYMILDICDDGIVNLSVPRPTWYETVVRTINNVELALHDISNVSDELSGIGAKTEAQTRE